MGDEERPARCGESVTRRSKGRVKRMAVEAAQTPTGQPMHLGLRSGDDSLCSQAVQLFGAATWQSAKRVIRQTVPFSMTEPVWLTTAGGGGCCITDLQFASPSVVSELSFQNFYAATVDILVCKPAPPTAASTAAAAAAAEALRSAFSGEMRLALPNMVTSSDPGSTCSVTSSVAAVTASAAAEAAALVAGATGGKGESSGLPGLEPEAAEFLRSLGLDLDPITGSTTSWKVSVRKKMLMPHPHYEMGSQERFSVTAKESTVPWSELLAMRLVLRQPSPSWTVFGVSGVVAFRDPGPPDAPTSVHGLRSYRSSRESGDSADGDLPCPLLAAVRRQTEAALAALPESIPREDRREERHRHGHSHSHRHQSGYEFFQLPKV